MREKDVQTLRAFHHHITALLKQKDKYTALHSRRVGRIFAVFAQFGWECWEEDFSVIELIGEIHDGGKIVMRNRGLKASGRLHGLEHTLKENHPLLGAEMIPVRLKIVRDPILYHHEHFNGEGYPRGLRGEKIPLTARVLAAVDAFDAMTGRRYQAKKTDQQIMRELEKNSGTQFDPDVVKVFKAFHRSNRGLFSRVYSQE